VFKICAEHPPAAIFVKRINDRRQTNTLAYEIAAVKLGVSAATVESAWKKFKVRKSDSRKMN
jgi:hypothetical protein